MKTWTTKDEKEIPYKKLEDSHLLNIISYLEKQSKKGVLATYRELVDDGFDGDSFVSDFVKVEIKLYGKDFLKLTDYRFLVKEANKRGILTK